MYAPTDADVGHLRAAVKQLWHIPIDYFDDYFLKVILYQSKGSIMNASQNLSTYCLRRLKIPELTLGLAIKNDNFPSVMDNFAWVPLNKKSPSGSWLEVLYFFEEDKIMSTSEWFQYAERVQFIKFWQNEERLPVADLAPYIVIMDFKHLTKKQAQYLDFSVVRKSFTLLSKSVRVENIHLVHIPDYAVYIMNIIRGFFSEKMSKKLVLHSNYKSLYDYLPKECLPSDLGGCEKSIKELQEIQKREFVSLTKKFETDNEFWTQFASKNKSLLCTKEESITGNFRKLDMD